MHKKARMDPVVGPPNCLVCQRGNTPDEPDTLDDFWVLDLERDVNWGDPAYLCKYCAYRVGLECGMIDHDILEAREAEIRSLNRQLHERQATIDSQERRLKAVKHGRAGVRSVKRQASL